MTVPLQAQLIRVVRFLGRSVELDRIRSSVSENSFESTTRRLYGTQRETGTADNTRFVRKGIVGDWKNHFSREAAEVFAGLAGATLVRLGYEPDEQWIDRYSYPTD